MNPGINGFLKLALQRPFFDVLHVTGFRSIVIQTYRTPFYLWSITLYLVSILFQQFLGFVFKLRRTIY